MPNITQEQLDQITEIAEFIKFIADEFGIVDDIELNSIGIFTFEKATLEIPDENTYLFDVEVTIDIAQEEVEEEPSQSSGEEATQKLEGNLSIEMTKTDVNDYKGKYEGTLQVPLAEGETKLTFNLAYQTRKQGTKERNIVVGVFDTDANPDVGNVNLSALVGGICPPLAELFPEELLDTFNLGANVLFVIDEIIRSSHKTVKRMLFSIGFEATIAFSKIPLVQDFLPENISKSQFIFEFLVALQTFSQQDLTLINGLLEEIGEKLKTDLKVKPPCSKINYLNRGSNLGARFEIGPFMQAWSLTLKPTKNTASRSTTNTNNNSGSVKSDDLVTITDNGIWLNVQQSFGPIYFDKVGLVFKKGEIRLTPKFVIDASRFILSLNGLYISTSLVDFKPDFNLDGFGLELKTRSLEIGGAFLVVQGEDGEKNYNEYLGTATIGFRKRIGPALALSAIGSFTNYGDSRKFALFLYLAADYPFGGPPFFFVLGLSGGFGYNHDLIVPPLEDIKKFPLVKEAIDGPKKIDPKDTGTIITEKLEALEEYIPPAIGSGFGAIGLKFTCFKIVDGFGLMTLGMSQGDFEINLLGMATLMLPTTINLGRFEPIAMAELAIAARFNPMEGVILVQGQLTENSYIFSRKCRLTGGFAYGLWFLPPRLGDFVFTQGGYHPRFKCADRYPSVPRLGFDWQIDENSYTTAQVYFALCGHGIMAGGLMHIRYQLGSVWAEFDAGLDLLFGWAPYHYDVEVHCFVNAGVGALSVGLGMGIHFWGPDFGCKFKIKIVIVKVTIKIGDQSSIYPLPISWDEFEGTFLPEPKDVCSITSIDGLVKQILEEKDGVETEIWIINPTVFEMSTDSLIPTKKAFVGDEEKTFATNTNFAINSMGVTKDELETRHKVTISKEQADNVKGKFKFEPITKLAPTSTWGEPNMINGHIKPPEVNGEQFIENVFFGFRILPAEPPKAGKTHEIGIEHLQYDTEGIDNAYLWESLTPFIQDSTLETQEAKRDRIQSTVTNNDQRNSILADLGCDLTQVEMDEAKAIANSFVFAPLVK
jgi:hypothetical protein